MKRFLVLVTTILLIVSFGLATHAATLTVGTGEDYTSIQEAIDVASATDEIYITNGTYEENLRVTKAITLIGESRDGVIIDTTSTTTRGIYVNADNVSISNITLLGPANYGLKAEGYTNLSLNNVKVTGCTNGTGVDLNGVNTATLTNIESVNNSKNGIALTDCSNIVINNMTTKGNSWGGLAIYAAGKWYDGGCNDITINQTDLTAISSIYSGMANGYTITNLNLPAEYKYAVKNLVYKPENTSYFTSLDQAILAATSVDHPQDSYIGAINTNNNALLDNSHLYVGDGMEIQTSINQVASAGTVNVESGTYQGNLFVNKPVTISGNISNTGAASNAPIIEGNNNLGNGFVIESNDITIEGFQIQNFEGCSWDGKGMGIHASSGFSNIVIANNTIRGINWASIFAWTDGSSMHDNWIVKDNIIKMGTWSQNNNVYGIELTNGSNSVIKGNIVTGGYAGILVTSTHNTAKDITVTDNKVSDTTLANIQITSGSAYHTTTAYLNNLTITNNQLIDGKDNGIIAWTYEDSKFNSIDIHKNHISGNKNKGIKNQSSTEFNASQNWWGSDLGLAKEQSEGPIKVYPWALNEQCTEFVNTIAVDDNWAEKNDFEIVTLDDQEYIYGLNAFSDIQSAINGAEPEDTVRLAAGTYQETVNLVTDVNIIGISSTDKPIINGQLTAPGSNNSWDNITIKNIELVNNSQLVKFVTGSQPAILNNVLFENVDFKLNGDSEGILVNDKHGLNFDNSGLTFKDCSFDDDGYKWLAFITIYSTNGGPITIDNFTFNNQNMGELINLGSDGQNVVVKDSSFQNGWVYLSGVTDAKVYNNTFDGSNTGYCALYLNGVSGGQVYRNTFVNLTETRGLGISAAWNETTNENIDIHHNIFDKITSKGIEVYNYTIYTKDKKWKSISPTYDTFKNITIRDNDFTGISGQPIVNNYDVSLFNLENIIADNTFATAAFLCNGDGTIKEEKIYTDIQDVIDQAKNGDTVKVYPGTYSEEIRIEKEITLLGKGMPTLTGDQAITILSDNVTIEGFNIEASQIGITAYSANNLTITGNTIQNASKYGIYVEGTTTGLQINHNDIFNNEVGIQIKPATKKSIMTTQSANNDASIGRVNNNNIQDNQTGIANETNAELDANNNYWGDPEGPSDDDITGNVDVSTWSSTLIITTTDNDEQNDTTAPEIDASINNGILTVEIFDDIAIKELTIKINDETLLVDTIANTTHANVSYSLPTKASLYEITVIAYDQADNASEPWTKIYNPGRPEYKPGESSGFGWDMWKH